MGRGEPVLASFRDPSEWVLITTQRLVWSNKAGVMRIALSAIEDVTVDLKTNAEMGARTKKDLSQLIVKTSGRDTQVNDRVRPILFCRVESVEVFRALKILLNHV
jgi:hypothetical protein